MTSNPIRKIPTTRLRNAAKFHNEIEKCSKVGGPNDGKNGKSVIHCNCWTLIITRWHAIIGWQLGNASQSCISSSSMAHWPARPWGYSKGLISCILLEHNHCEKGDKFQAKSFVMLCEHCKPLSIVWNIFCLNFSSLPCSAGHSIKQVLYIIVPSVSERCQWLGSELDACWRELGLAGRGGGEC